MTTPAQDFAREHADTFRQQLHDFLTIPSVSTDSAFDDDVHRAAEWLRDTMQEAGLSAELIQVEDGHPLVYGEWLEAGDDAPTVLKKVLDGVQSKVAWCSPGVSKLEPSRRHTFYPMGHVCLDASSLPSSHNEAVLSKGKRQVLVSIPLLIKEVRT